MRNTSTGRRLLLICACSTGLLLAAGHTIADAQTDAPDTLLQVGSRVRVFESAPRSRSMAGQLTALPDSTLTLRTRTRGVHAVPVLGIDSVQVSHGRRHLPAAFLGLWVGAAAGAAILGGAGIVHDAVVDQSGVPAVAYGLYYGILIGAPVGAAWMGTRGFESWRTVWRPQLAGPDPR